MSVKQLEGEEVDVDWLRLVKANHDVNIRLASDLSLDGLPHECNLLAVSNIWGLIIAAGEQDVRIHRLSQVHTQLESGSKDSQPTSTPIQTISLPSRPVWIRLAMSEERMVVALIDGTVHIYNLADVLRGQTSPYHSISANIPTQLIDLLPNPAGPSTDSPSRYIALLGKEGMILADIEEKRLLEPVAGPFTSGCWSAKGKQIVLGKPDGRLIQYTPEGVVKAEIPPPELENPSYPSFVHWLDTNLFLVAYAPVNGEPDDPLDIFVISRTKAETSYTKFYDPLNTMGVQGRSGSFRFYAGLKQWGEKTKYLGFMMSGLASEVAVLHGMEDGRPVWEILMLEETARAIMPIGKAAEEDMSCIGLDLDLTSTKPIPRGIVDGIELPDLPPPPRLLVYTQKGVIISFNVQYPEAGAYQGMITPKEMKQGEVMTAPTSQVSTPEDSATPGPNGFAGFGQSAFGTPAKPAFGQASTSAFGSSSFGSSAFGAPAQSAGGFGAFGQPSTTPTSTPSKPTAFAGFGQSTTPTSTPKPAAFGGTAPAFGSSAFGQSSTPGFGASAFGQKPAFGQPSTPAFGSTSTPSAFGNTSSPSSGGFSAFGNTKPMAAQTGFGFGASAFGTTSKELPKSSTGGSAFGASSGFGQSAFGTPSWGSTQASTPSSQTLGGFAGFGQQSSSSFSGFGQPKAVSPAPTPATIQEASDDFGLGGFASALETKTDVPGLADSPPTSPVLGGARPSGLDDDSPPGSPTFTPTPTKSSPQPASSSSFIKPATAFGGTSSAFSGFGQSPSSSSTPKTPAFGSGAPPAFSTPSQSTSSTPAFGQSSGISKPSFGGSAFGQSSKPTGSAFGQTSKPGGGFGNISGGFGGFAAKSANADVGGTSGAGVGGGFGGFAAKASSTGSAFGHGGGFAFGAAKEGGGDIFGSGKKGDMGISTASSSTGTPSFGKETKDAIPSELPPATPTSPEQAEGYDVPTPVKAEEAILPAGYDTPVTLSSPGVAPEPAVLPAGYDKPSAISVNKELEVAVLPAGYDVPVPTESGGDEQEEVEDAVQIALPEESQEGNEGTEVVGTAKGAAEVALPDFKTEQVDEEDEGVVVGVDGRDGDDGAEDYEEEEDQEDYGEEDEDAEGDEYDEEEQEDFAEEEEEEEEEEEKAPSELSVVPEEAEDEESESDQPEPTPSGTKSPPTWFASTPTSSSTTKTPEQPSLSSRLGPLPPAPPAQAQAQQPKISFANRHAARTASPLGSQPPHTPEESSTPPVSPMKPISSGSMGGFNLFGKETEQVKPEELIFAPKAVLSDKADKPVEGKSEPKTSFGFGLGRPPAAAAAKEMPAAASTGFSFDLSKQSNNAQPPQKSAFGFGLGLGQPPAQPAGKSAFDFGQNKTGAQPHSTLSSGDDKAEKASPSSLDMPKPSTQPLFGDPTSHTMPAPTPAQQPAVPPLPTPATTFSIPTRQTVPPRAQRKENKDPTMAGVLEGMISDLEADVRQLQLYLSAAEKQHATLRETNFVKINLSELDKHTALPFSSIKDTSAIADELLKQLQEYKRKDTGIDTKLGELQSLLLKTDMKSGQLEQYAKARDDPDFAKGIEVTQLSAQQASDQKRINEAVRGVEAGLEDLEMGLAGLQRRLDEAKRGETSASPVEKLERSVRDLDMSIRDKQESLDDLSRRLSSIKVSTPASPRLTSQYISHTPPATTRSTPTKRIALPVPSDIQEEIRQAVENDTTAQLIAKLKGRQTRVTKASSSRSSIFSASSKEPIRIDKQPDLTPEQLGLGKPAPEIKEEPQSPAPSPFSGIKFSLDPGQVSSVPRSVSGGRSNSNRQHAPAAKLDLSASSTLASGVAPGGFSFALPSPSTPNKKGEPRGFFSLSEYAAK